MNAWTFDARIGFPVTALVTILLFVFCHRFGILEWILPAISCITVIMLFTNTEKGKRTWETPGVPHIGWCFGILAAVFVAVVILLPEGRTEPTIEELVAELWFHGLKYLLVLLVMVTGLGAAGWQMWSASRKLRGAGEQFCGIVAGSAAVAAWGVMLAVSLLWLSQSPPLLQAINQAMR